MYGRIVVDDSIGRESREVLQLQALKNYELSSCVRACMLYAARNAGLINSLCQRKGSSCHKERDFKLLWSLLVAVAASRYCLASLFCLCFFISVFLLLPLQCS